MVVHVSRERLRAVGTLHESFARRFQAELSRMLRVRATLRVRAVDQLAYSEFINSMPNPTDLYIASAEPLKGAFILEIDPIIAFPISEFVPEVVGGALAVLQEAWSSKVPIQFRLTGREFSPQQVPIMPPNGPVISVSSELTIGKARGFMNLCIPTRSIQEIINRF